MAYAAIKTAPHLKTESGPIMALGFLRLSNYSSKIVALYVIKRQNTVKI
jgi:hypothetical protein